MLPKHRFLLCLPVIALNHLLPVTFLSGGEYMPTIANGLITALSLLVSIAVSISMLAYQRLPEGGNQRDRLSTWIRRVLYGNVIIIMILTVIGYRLIVSGDFQFAYYVFTDFFIVAISANFLLLHLANGTLSYLSWTNSQQDKK
jgi:hypothetical protein